MNPIATWATADASPSGIAIVGDARVPGRLRGSGSGRYRSRTAAARQPLLAGAYGRLRDAAVGPGRLAVGATSNHDGRGYPGADDDRILRIEP